MQNVQKAREEDRKRTIVVPFLFQARFACCKKTHVGGCFVGAKYVPHEACELSAWNAKPWSGGTCPTKSRPYALRRSALHEHCWNVVSVRPFKCGVLHKDAESHYMHRQHSFDESFGHNLNSLLCLIPFYAHAPTCMSAVCSQHVFPSSFHVPAITV